MICSSTAVKLGLLGSLHLSQGRPYGFFTQALSVGSLAVGLALGAVLALFPTSAPAEQPGKAILPCA